MIAGHVVSASTWPMAARSCADLNRDRWIQSPWCNPLHHRTRLSPVGPKTSKAELSPGEKDAMLSRCRVGLECRTGEQPPCARAVLRRMTEMRACATCTQYPRACCTRRPTAGCYRSPGASAFNRPLNQASPSLSLPLSLPLHFTHPHIPLFFSFFFSRDVLLLRLSLFSIVSLFSLSSSPSSAFSSSSSSSLSASSSSSFISSYFFFSSSLLFAMLPCRTTARPDALPVRTDSVRVHACRITKRVLFAGAIVGMWLFGLVV